MNFTNTCTRQQILLLGVFDFAILNFKDRLLTDLDPSFKLLTQVLWDIVENNIKLLFWPKKSILFFPETLPPTLGRLEILNFWQELLLPKFKKLFLAWALMETKGNKILRYGCRNVTRFCVFQDRILKLSG